MTQHLKPLRIAAGLLLASAAFPLTPALSQVTPTDPAAPAPAQTTAPAAGAQASEPVVNTRPSGREPADPVAADAAETTARPAARRTARTATRPASRTERRAAPQPRTARALAPAAPAPAPAPAPVAAPAPAPAAPPPVAAIPPADVPPAAAPAPEAAAPAAAPAPAPETRRQDTPVWPWLLAAGLAVAGLLYLLSRRRRRTDEADHVAYAAPVAAVEPRPEPVAAAAPAAAAAAGDRPWIDIKMRPVRAGVGEDAARVQFQLDIQNTGSVHASDVRIATWMLPGGAEPTEVERMLIQRPAEAERRETELAPGEKARLETEVALPREGLHDAILPVVVADARYTLPGGGEGRTSASFAIGVPDGEELAMFDVENPSGLHDGVEARPHGTPKRD
ncbi:MAG TPA: hypothetical protein VF662_00845 [Allosphingosinicella sp.]